MSNNKVADKPFKTFDEQIEILKGRNIEVQNIKSAKKILNTVSYYKLVNGYKQSRIVAECDKDLEMFQDGTSIEDLYNLHIFDITLQSILFKYILSIETSFKTKLAYLIAKQYGVFESEYLSQESYISSGNKRNLRKRVLKELIDDKNETMYTPTKYYRDGDEQNNTPPKNHIPPWILMQNISFTRSIRWYSILKSQDKKKIYSQFSITKKIIGNDEVEKNFFLDSLKILRDYRNTVAHGYRSINLRIQNCINIESLNKIIPNTVLSKNEFPNFGCKDLYSVLISIVALTDYMILEDNLIKELSAFFSAPIGEEVRVLANLPDDFLGKLTILKDHIKECRKKLIINKSETLYYLKDKKAPVNNTSAEK